MLLVDELLHGVIENIRSRGFEHFQLALHDPHFLDVFVFGDYRILHVVGDKLDGDSDPPRRTVDVKRRDRVGSIGVRLPAQRIDKLGNLCLSAAGGRSAGQNVFEHVAKSRPQVFAFISAARVLHVTPHGGHGGGMILLYDHRHPVGDARQRHPLAERLLRGVSDLDFGDGPIVIDQAGLDRRLLGHGRLTETNCEHDKTQNRPWKHGIPHNAKPQMDANERQYCSHSRSAR